MFRERFSEAAIGKAGVERIRRYAHEHIGTVDAGAEGYLDPGRQRDLSVKFHLGHDHRVSDDLVLKGRMGDRHLSLIATFMDDFGLGRDLSGLTVLDIGCWTGGVSLLLTALGARVIAIEEVRKYAATTNFLADVFGVADRLRCVPESLYSFLPKHADRFDLVVYAGVVYHVTDPVLSLRHIFSALKNGGRCFIETYGIQHPESVCLYEGPRHADDGQAGGMSRGGWNYFVPSPKCLGHWCLDAGFDEVKVAPANPDSRIFAAARRSAFRDILRAGLSSATAR